MIKSAGLASLIVFASCAAHRPDRVLAITTFDDVRADFRGEPVISGHTTADQLRDRLLAGGLFKGVERRYGSVPSPTAVPADWIVLGTVEATVPWEAEAKFVAEVSLRVRVVRVEDGAILYAKIHRGEAVGTLVETELMAHLLEVCGLLEDARRQAVAMLVREIEALVR